MSVMTLGGVFRAARGAKGVDLEEASAELKIEVHRLAALEGDEEGDVPLAHMAGFARSYGNWLGLDGETAAAWLRSGATRAYDSRSGATRAYNSGGKEERGEGGSGGGAIRRKAGDGMFRAGCAALGMCAAALALWTWRASAPEAALRETGEPPLRLVELARAPMLEDAGSGGLGEGRILIEPLERPEE